MTSNETTDTTTIRREIERQGWGKPQIWVSIEVKWDDHDEADAIADGLAKAIHDEIEWGEEDDE